MSTILPQKIDNYSQDINFETNKMKPPSKQQTEPILQ